MPSSSHLGDAPDELARRAGGHRQRNPECISGLVGSKASSRAATAAAQTGAAKWLAIFPAAGRLGPQPLRRTESSLHSPQTGRTRRPRVSPLYVRGKHQCGWDNNRAGRRTRLHMNVVDSPVGVATRD